MSSIDTYLDLLGNQFFPNRFYFGYQEQKDQQMVTFPILQAETLDRDIVRLCLESYNFDHQVNCLPEGTRLENPDCFLNP